MDVLFIVVVVMLFLIGSLSFIALVILIAMHTRNKTLKNPKSVKKTTPPPAPILNQISKTISTKPIITHYSDTPDIKQYPTTTAIYKSGQFNASERRTEYRRRGKSPSGVIDGIYNDMYRENGVSYNDINRDWDADA